ncbi:MAG: hypothetical protein SFX73_05195 [Kofleriaceae bacterium]|nr:hypothetical protein [Kofleriaceae bacterium]
MVKLLVGILKGAVIGGALGYGLMSLYSALGFEANPWVTYGLIGAVVGLFVGKPIWALIRDKNSTSVVAILKSVFGFGVGCGLYALIAKAWGPELAVSTVPNVFAWPPALGGAIGAVYGGFVELDDAIGDDKAADSKEKPAPAKKK